MQRRTFLKTGVAGAALLALAARVPAAAARAAESVSARGLSASDRAVVAAIVPVMLAGALPAEAETQRKAVATVVDGVSQAIAGMPPATRAELGELFMLLDLAPARRLLAGVSAPWPDASPQEIAAFLQKWRNSPLALLQSGYQALHDLIIASWYALPASWAAIRYPGAPEI
ncbi:MAG: hypothetical protein MUC55_07550 [Burkholderiales bacterium]|jgi:hypothetical protein|nr:hypothetical protein [Burkholderiales bacterium]